MGQTQIQIEQDASEKYSLTKDEKHSDLVALTIDNVARVEAVLKLDSRYKKSGLVEMKPEIKSYTKGKKKGTCELQYQGSTAYWMQQLKIVLEQCKSVPSQILLENTNNNLVEAWNNNY